MVSIFWERTQRVPFCAAEPDQGGFEHGGRVAIKITGAGRFLRKGFNDYGELVENVVPRMSWRFERATRFRPAEQRRHSGL